MEKKYFLEIESLLTEYNYGTYTYEKYIELCKQIRFKYFNY